jgi:SAM-dependent methyltransferase
LAIGSISTVWLLEAFDIRLTVVLASIILALTGAVTFGFQSRPWRFGLGVGAVLLVGMVCFSNRDPVLHTERSFFGVLRVKHDPRLNLHKLVHGSTTHGMQSLEPDRRTEPLAYYHHRGPLGDVFKECCHPKKRCHVGVIGLGTGAISSYVQEGQQLTYFEIDPAIVRIAKNPQYFTYLAACPAEVGVVLGDARLKLAEAPDQHFDMLVVDAFSSDSIPVHLITREAISLYLRKLAGDGVLVLHISNRYLELEPVIGNLAADARVFSRIRRDRQVTTADYREGKLISTWVVMAKGPEALGRLADDPSWYSVQVDPSVPLWTDTFSNILSVIDWW